MQSERAEEKPPERSSTDEGFFQKEIEPNLGSIQNALESALRGSAQGSNGADRSTEKQKNPDLASDFVCYPQKDSLWSKLKKKRQKRLKKKKQKMKIEKK